MDTELNPLDTELTPLDTELDPLDTELDPLDTELELSLLRLWERASAIRPRTKTLDSLVTELGGLDTELDLQDTELRALHTRRVNGLGSMVRSYGASIDGDRSEPTGTSAPRARCLPRWYPVRGQLFVSWS